MSRTALAPWASAHMLGMGDTSPAGAPYPDQSYDLVFDVTLTSQQILLTSKPIERDADFIWRGLILNSQTGIYKVQFDINGWYKLSDAQIVNANYQSDPSSPYPIWPELPVPAGGRIGIFITDLSVATNAVEIIFRGVKRFTAAAK